MGNATVKELERAGVEFRSYRELAAPSASAQASARWPLLAMTDQIIVAERWKRETLQPATKLPTNVTPLPQARPAALQTDWFHDAQSAPAVPAGARAIR